MLAELAAANAAFAVIKQTVAHGKELATAGAAINNFVFAKEELRRRGDKKKGSLFKKTQNTSEFEEFMALEQIKKNEEELRSIMQLYGRAGLWNDWQKFQAQARKSRQVEQKLAAKKREEMIEATAWGALVLVGLAAVGGMVFWGLLHRGLI